MGYNCAECKSRVRRRHFMPAMDTGGAVQRNWNGHIWGRCFSCSMGKEPLARPSNEPWHLKSKDEYARARAWPRKTKKRHACHSNRTHLD
eukprot:11292670-Prorocentrum_lima.AAC.1